MNVGHHRGHERPGLGSLRGDNHAVDHIGKVGGARHHGGRCPVHLDSLQCHPTAERRVIIVGSYVVLGVAAGDAGAVIAQPHCRALAAEVCAMRQEPATLALHGDIGHAVVHGRDGHGVERGDTHPQVVQQHAVTEADGGHSRQGKAVGHATAEVALGQ